MAVFRKALCVNALSCAFLFGCAAAGDKNGAADASAAKDNNTEKWMVRVIPLFDYAMVTATPSSWRKKPVSKEKTDNAYSAEFLPEGETLGDRTEKITLLGYKGVTLSPGEYAKKTQAAVQTVCGKDNSAWQMMEENDETAVFASFCGKAEKDLPGEDGLGKDQGEINVYRVDARGDNLYVIFHSWRGDAFSPEKENEAEFPVSLAGLNKRAEVLGSAVYCSREEPSEGCEKYAKFFSAKTKD